MTVKCFTKDEKDHIVQLYTIDKFSVTRIAEAMLTSTRTIGRVLVERGLATPVPRLKGEAYHALKACQKHGIDPLKLDDLLISRPMTSDQVDDYIGCADRSELERLLHHINCRVDDLILGSLPAIPNYPESQQLELPLFPVNSPLDALESPKLFNEFTPDERTSLIS